MQILFVVGNLPVRGHSIRAAPVLVREALIAFANRGHDVVLQPLIPANGVDASHEESAAIEWLGTQGIETLSFIHAPPNRPHRRLGLVRDALAAGAEDFFPALALLGEVTTRAERMGADLVFHLWSSDALAACSGVGAPVFAYYGNPDHKPFAARLRHPELFDVPTGTPSERVRLELLRRINERRRRASVELTRTCTWLGCVTALDVPYWIRAGHQRAFYLQNMWPLEVDGAEPNAQEPGKIVGSLGGLYATGNTFGLHFLGTEIVPALERRLGRRFEVSIFGAGRPTSAVAQALDRPGIRVRGFVHDIDAEIRSSQVFLLANNSNSDFVGGHTRVLHAWSLGSCLVAHTNTAAAMPEIVHEENALLGSTPDEIAEQVVRALNDAKLRARLGEGGRRTLERAFTPQVVVDRVLEIVGSPGPA